MAKSAPENATKRFVTSNRPAFRLVGLMLAAWFIWHQAPNIRQFASGFLEGVTEARADG